MTISCSSCQSFSQLISQLTCCWSVSYVSQCNQLINQSTILPINLVRSNQNFLFYLCQGGLPVLTVPQGSHARVVLIIVYIVSIRCCDKCDMWFHGDCIGITKDEAQMIRHFYCKTCLGNVYSTCIYCYKHLDD